MSDPDSLSNTQIGPYRVGAQLGVGGMGAVYAAVHERIGRRVAIKVLHSSYARDTEIVQRFFNEARAVNLIDHPGLVQVSDFDQLPNGAAYLVMELLQGESLAQRLARTTAGLTVAEVLLYGWQIADTLAAVHTQQIVHRDLKPSNVMLVKDAVARGGRRTKLLDFGIAKLGSDRLLPNQAPTQTKTMMGTLVYMSPEQCRSARMADGRSDVYSLGIMLYEMLCGRPPFLGDSEVAIITMHLHDEPKPLTEVLPGVLEPLSDLVHKMLRKDKEARPTMRAMATALGEMTERFGAAADVAASGSSDRSLPIGLASTLARAVGQSTRAAGRRTTAAFGTSLLLVAGAALWSGFELGSRRAQPALSTQAASAPAQPSAVAPPPAPPVAPPQPALTTVAATAALPAASAPPTSAATSPSPAPPPATAAHTPPAADAKVLPPTGAAKPPSAAGAGPHRQPAARPEKAPKSDRGEKNEQPRHRDTTQTVD